jgi:hypothetical protein
MASDGRVAHRLAGHERGLQEWHEGDQRFYLKPTTGCGREVWNSRMGYGRGTLMRWELLNHELVRPCTRCQWET